MSAGPLEEARSWEHAPPRDMTRARRSRESVSILQTSLVVRVDLFKERLHSDCVDAIVCIYFMPFIFAEALGPHSGQP